MGAIITSEDLKPVASSGSFNVKEIEGFIGVLERMFEKAMKLKQMKEVGNQQQVMTNQGIGTPQQVVNTPTKEVITYKTKEIDEVKLKQFLEDVFVKMADKLPDDIKEMKIGDILGQNFIDFKYSIKKMGVTFEIDKEVILEELSKAVIQTLPKLEKS